MELSFGQFYWEDLKGGLLKNESNQLGKIILACPPSRNANVMAGAIPAAIWDHEVTLRLKVKYKDGEAEGWKEPGSWVIVELPPLPCIACLWTSFTWERNKLLFDLATFNLYFLLYIAEPILPHRSVYITKYHPFKHRSKHVKATDNCFRTTFSEKTSWAIKALLSGIPNLKFSLKKYWTISLQLRISNDWLD